MFRPNPGAGSRKGLISAAYDIFAGGFNLIYFIKGVIMRYQKSLAWRTSLFFAFCASFFLVVPPQIFAQMMDSRMQHQQKEYSYDAFYEEHVQKVRPILEDMGLNVSELAAIEAIISSEQIREYFTAMMADPNTQMNMLLDNPLIVSQVNSYAQLSPEMRAAVIKEAQRLATRDNLMRIGLSENQAVDIVAQLTSEDLYHILSHDSIADYAAGYKVSPVGWIVLLLLPGAALLIWMASSSSSSMLSLTLLGLGGLLLIYFIFAWFDSRKLAR